MRFNVQAVIVQTPPPPPAPPLPAQAPQARVFTLSNNSPSAIYEAFRNQRRELINQRERLIDQREEIADQLTEDPGSPSDANAQGLQARLVAIDQRLASVETQIAESEAAVARAAAVPGAVVPEPPRPREPGPPEEFWVLSGLFMFIVILPLTIAYSRRIWRRGATVVSQIPQELYERFARLEQGVDTIALEVERIGEGQRYLTRMYTERGLDAAQPVEVSAKVLGGPPGVLGGPPSAGR